MLSIAFDSSQFAYKAGGLCHIAWLVAFDNPQSAHKVADLCRIPYLSIGMSNTGDPTISYTTVGLAL